MNKARWFAILGLLMSAALPLPVHAQPESESPNSQNPTEPENGATGSAADLRISPRLGIGHNSSGAGYDGFTRFEGFIPLFQTPGSNITFLDTRLLLDNDGNIGGNILLGHRFYDANLDRIWGGYLGLDNRKTDESDFYQFGIGFESLGEVWDFRVNGYLPIGDTRQLVNERVLADGGATTVSTRFQGHLLLLESVRERQVARSWEAALGGVDAEVGARIARWEEGDLRAYGGLYFYDAEGTPSTLGWRLRLEARPTQNLNLGLALQDDDLFGTNLAFSVGLTWPRVRPQGPITETETVVARLGEPIARINSIAVDGQQEVETEVDRTVQPLMNPEEEQPYQFQHVTLGRNRGGDGTFERPFGTLRAALNVTRSDGNDIVYVDQGDRSTIPAFRIPDRVQVLSRGPAQILAGMPFPGFPAQTVRLPFSPSPNFEDGILVRLPFSGDGNFPVIQDASATNLVTLGNRTTLSGFRVVNASENGIIGSNIDNVELRNNTITNSGGRGIFLENVADSVVMLNNTVTGSRGGAGSGQGILIRNGEGSSVEVTMTEHVLTDNRVGLEITASGDVGQRQGVSQTVSIDTLVLRNNQQQGLRLEAEQLGNQEVTLTNGEISDNGSTGVLLQAINIGSQEVTIENSTISRNTGDGIRAIGGILAGSSTAAQEVFIRNNTIEDNTGNGINIEGNEVVAQEFAIDSNIIRNNGGSGIRAVANNVAFQEYITDPANDSLGISNNTISGNGDQGLVLNANDSATLVADIQGNRLENNRTNGSSDLEVATSSNSTNVCVVLLNNTSPAGIRLDNNSVSLVPGLFEIGNIANLEAENTGRVELLPNRGVFTDKPNETSCFRQR